MAKSVRGLDIGSKYIKFVELAQYGRGKNSLISVGMTPAPLKGINSDANIDLEALATIIKKLLRDGGIRTKQVNVALPETNVFTRIIEVPPLSEKELSSAIKWEAEQYVPLPLEEVQMDFSIVGETMDRDGHKKLNVLLVAAPKVVISRYDKILNLCDLEPLAMETEIISASRALLPHSSDKPVTVMVVNIGAQTTDFSILKNSLISFTRSIPTGGDHLTRALAQDLGIPLPQAEEFKKTYGLRENQVEGKVRRSLEPIFSVMVEEIKRSQQYFVNKYPEENISALILSGGTAKMPGLVESLVTSVGIESQIGNPWISVGKDPQRFARLEDEGPIFTVATGLAMRED
jgi:type IV pilus assembly protein PilM